jgi:transposase
VDRLAEQRRRAAARGQEVRVRRASVKRAIAAGEVDLVADVLRDDQKQRIWAAAIAEEVRVGELLRSIPGIGPTTAAEILEPLEIPSDRPLGDLDQKARNQLAKAIEGN